MEKLLVEKRRKYFDPLLAYVRDPSEPGKRALLELYATFGEENSDVPFALDVKLLEGIADGDEKAWASLYYRVQLSPDKILFRGLRHWSPFNEGFPVFAKVCDPPHEGASPQIIVWNKEDLVRYILDNFPKLAAVGDQAVIILDPDFIKIIVV